MWTLGAMPLFMIQRRLSKEMDCDHMLKPKHSIRYLYYYPSNYFYQCHLLKNVRHNAPFLHDTVHPFGLSSLY